MVSPTTTSLLPSAEQATELQFVIGALVSVQVWASAGWRVASRPPPAATASSRRFMFMIFWAKKWRRASTGPPESVVWARPRELPQP